MEQEEVPVQLFEIERNGEYVRLKGIIDGKLRWVEMTLISFDEAISDIFLDIVTQDGIESVEVTIWSCIEELFEDIMIEAYKWEKEVNEGNNKPRTTWVNPKDNV